MLIQWPELPEKCHYIGIIFTPDALRGEVVTAASYPSQASAMTSSYQTPHRKVFVRLGQTMRLDSPQKPVFQVDLATSDWFNGEVPPETVNFSQIEANLLQYMGKNCFLKLTAYFFIERVHRPPMIFWDHSVLQDGFEVESISGTLYFHKTPFDEGEIDRATWTNIGQGDERLIQIVFEGGTFDTVAEDTFTKRKDVFDSAFKALVKLKRAGKHD